MGVDGFQTTCTCGRRYNVRRELHGKFITCKSCRATLELKDPSRIDDDDQDQGPGPVIDCNRTSRLTIPRKRKRPTGSESAPQEPGTATRPEASAPELDSVAAGLARASKSGRSPYLRESDSGERAFRYSDSDRLDAAESGSSSDGETAFALAVLSVVVGIAFVVAAWAAPTIPAYEDLRVVSGPVSGATETVQRKGELGENARLVFTIETSNGGQAVRYRDDWPRYREVVAAVQRARAVVASVDPRNGNVCELRHGERAVVAYAQVLGAVEGSAKRTQTSGFAFLGLGLVLGALGVWMRRRSR